MGRKGQRKYECQECKETRLVHWVELNRRSRPRCNACGSQWLEPYSEAAIEDQKIGALNVLEHSSERGSVRASEEVEDFRNSL